MKYLEVVDNCWNGFRGLDDQQDKEPPAPSREGMPNVPQ